MPSRLENLGNAFLLRVRRQWGGRLHQLRETEDRIDRAAKLMAHAGKEIRFREVGYLRGGFGALKLDDRFLERLLVAFALRDVSSDCDVLKRFTVLAQVRHDGRVHPVEGAVLGFVLDHAFPHSAIADRLPDASNELIGMKSRIDDPVVLAE